MYTKILLPLDGSDLAAQAIEHAGKLAAMTGAEVVVLQVIDSEAQLIAETSGMAIEPLPGGSITVDAAREAVSAQRQAATQNLEAVRARLAADGVNVSVEVREGNPGDVIVQTVEELHCDVVVMATHGRTGIRRAILGSITDHVARHTPGASVLLIRPGE